MREIPNDIESLQITCGTYDKNQHQFTALRNPTDIDIMSNYNHMDDEWKKDCYEHRWWAQDSYEKANAFFNKEKPLSKELFALKTKILTYGGDMVCMPPYQDADTSHILNYGQIWNGKNPIIKRGMNNHCHQNAAIYWHNHKDNTRICTGYALSNDGMWREHSWLIQLNPRSNKIIETTVPRVLYFGYAMTQDLCEAFYQAVDADIYL